MSRRASVGAAMVVLVWTIAVASITWAVTTWAVTTRPSKGVEKRLKELEQKARRVAPSSRRLPSTRLIECNVIKRRCQNALLDLWKQCNKTWQ